MKLKQSDVKYCINQIKITRSIVTYSNHYRQKVGTEHSLVDVGRRGGRYRSADLIPDCFCSNNRVLA